MAPQLGECRLEFGNDIEKQSVAQLVSTFEFAHAAFFFFVFSSFALARSALQLAGSPWRISIVPEIKLTSCKLCAVRWLAPASLGKYDSDDQVLSNNMRKDQLHRARSLAAFATNYRWLHSFLSVFDSYRTLVSPLESRVELFFEIEYTNLETWFSINEKRQLTADECVDHVGLAIKNSLHEFRRSMNSPVVKQMKKFGFTIDFNQEEMQRQIRNAFAGLSNEVNEQFERINRWTRAEFQQPGKRTMFLSMSTPITAPLQFQVFNRA